jgi:hypothetical protein
MRIVSRFKDYYDSALAYGQDDGIIYIRETEIHHEKCGSWFPTYGTTYGETGGVGGFTTKGFSILFCNKLYRCFQMISPEDDFFFCYKLEQVDRIIAGLDKRTQEVYNYQATNDYWRDLKYKGFKRYDIGRWFGHPDYPNKRNNEVVIDWNNRAKQFCESRKCPAILFESDGSLDRIIVHNPILKSVDFIKAVDPFTAFQELSMWLGNFANNEDKIPPISNSDMIESKGFDLKTSFRKPKTKH